MRSVTRVCVAVLYGSPATCLLPEPLARVCHVIEHAYTTRLRRCARACRTRTPRTRAKRAWLPRAAAAAARCRRHTATAPVHACYARRATHIAHAPRRRACARLRGRDGPAFSITCYNHSLHLCCQKAWVLGLVSTNASLSSSSPHHRGLVWLLPWLHAGTGLIFSLRRGEEILKQEKLRERLWAQRLCPGREALLVAETIEM